MAKGRLTFRVSPHRYACPATGRAVLTPGRRARSVREDARRFSHPQALKLVQSEPGPSLT